MCNKKWQAVNSWIQHGILACIGMSFFFWWQQDILAWQKIVYPLLSLLLTIVVGSFLHKRYANKMVKVYQMEYGDVAWLVQRELKKLHIPFIKNSDDELMQLDIRSKGVSVRVESFPLNMLMDDHLSTISATKITVTPIQKQRPFITQLCDAIDRAFSSYTPINSPSI
ncbi:MAG: hypothetical protein DHS20C20_14980 [Ardenticatenaceae bacterium]|nr:MAG: hypothetical protein DHS20C20_14980 [Ardenticatenaceae bacterium]